MIRAGLIFLGLAVVGLLWHVADSSTVHTAWLVFLGFACGVMFGIVAWLELTSMPRKAER